MPRVYGAKDKKKRKTSGYKNYWKKYHKKHKKKSRKNKEGNFVPYTPKRKRSDPVKLWIWEVRPMNRDRIKNFPKKLRAKIRKTVYYPYMRIDVLPSELPTNPDQLGAFMLNTIRHDGEFILKMWGHAKNKFGCTARQVARVIIKDSPTGLRYFVQEHSRISRYWFWKG